VASSFLWHTQEVGSVTHELKTDLEQGLSNKEAASRLVTYGPNQLPERERIPWADIFLRQHISLMIPILVLASVILVRTGSLNGAAAVISILIVSIILSGFQAVKSERLFRYLRKFANSSMYTRVLRSGHVGPVKATDLVPGDIICFEAGDQIAGDGRLVEAKQLTIDESQVAECEEATEPVEKDAATLSEDVPVHLRKNMVFMGTMVTNGSGRAIVTTTGAQTQLAQVSVDRARKVEAAQRSLLEAKLSRKGLWFAGGCIAASAIFWAVVMLLDIIPPPEGVMACLGFLMAAWPMGLIEAVTMALTVGMKRLSERQIVIRRFLGAEALASATAICSDKTGIMTQNRMTVKKVFVDGRIMDVEGDGYDPESGGFPPDAEEDSPDLPLLLTVASMCTNTEVKNTPEGWSVIGDPTEAALIVAGMKGGINKDELGLSLTKIAELPFDPERKRMSVVFRAPKDEIFVFTKGSLETILDICGNVQLHGYMDNLDIGRQRAIWAVNQSFARDSMRSLAFAYCQLKDEPEEYTVEVLERDLVFVGIMGIVDPPRHDAKLAVKKCLIGAVQPIMLTDDYLDTAFAFAQDLEIVQEGSAALTGAELDILGEKEYSSLAERFAVYSDISPIHKLRIVRTLKERGEVTAVIGGRARDVDAIREADVGIAAGRTGSSVTIDASDIVLMDDSFGSAVDAIEGMRGAYGNAKKIIRYLLSASSATAGTILLSLIIRIFWEDFPFPPLLFLHVLWINLLAGSIPALAIIFNPVTDDVMKDGPYQRGSIFDGGLRSKILIRGILTAFLALIAFTFSLGSSDSWEINQGRAMTATFTVLVMSQLAFAFQCRRTPDEGFFRKFLTSKLLLGITLVAILLHLSIIYISPVSTIFRTKPLLPVDWIPILVAFVICSLPLDELFNTHTGNEERGEIVEESV
jgi:Ca2+-transporting ATPase